MIKITAQAKAKQLRKENGEYKALELARTLHKNVSAIEAADVNTKFDTIKGVRKLERFWKEVADILNKGVESGKTKKAAS